MVESDADGQTGAVGDHQETVTERFPSSCYLPPRFPFPSVELVPLEESAKFRSRVGKMKATGFGFTIIR